MRLPPKVTSVGESGEDLSGLSREAFSEFWSSFLDRNADSETFRIPSLNPHYALEEWQVVGRILAKGYIDHQFFPLQLAPAFFQAVMFGEDNVSAGDLYESFLYYISKMERECVKKALDGDQTGPVSSEVRDVLDEIFDREGCHTIPTDEQIRPSIMQVAHKCIIQNSSYVIDCMGKVVRDALLIKFPTMESISCMYAALKPTAKKVCEMLQSNPQTKGESQSYRFLMQFVRAQDENGLKKLLRFLTGASTASVPSIQVQFVNLSGLSRRPIAHTCGPTLELPCTYASYRELRNELQYILGSGYLQMDIL